MAAEKTVAMSFRVSPRFKELLEQAAAREYRSQVNMLEVLLYEYCETAGLRQQVTDQVAANEGKK
jgi:hypothetical protein